MADFCDGAGSGDRTRITSLEGFGSDSFLPFFRREVIGNSTNEAGFNGEHREVLPQNYRRLSDEDLNAARLRCKSTPRTSFTRVVYFAGGDGGSIKIGMTCDVKRRLKELRVETKRDIRILAVVEGGSFRECRYHTRFAAHRAEGEWFAPHPDILAEIERLAH